jgi:hypothetical protein
VDSDHYADVSPQLARGETASRTPRKHRFPQIPDLLAKFHGLLRGMTGRRPKARSTRRVRKSMKSNEIFGAGDGIRTHDPNLGKVVL